MKLRYFLLVLLVTCSELVISRNSKSIVWNVDTNDTKTLEFKFNSSELNSDFLVFSAPVVIHNNILGDLSLCLLEYDTSDKLVKNSQVWIGNDLVIESVEDREFRLLVKPSSANTINPDIVSKDIILKTGGEVTPT